VVDDQIEALLRLDQGIVELPWLVESGLAVADLALGARGASVELLRRSRRLSRSSALGCIDAWEGGLPYDPTRTTLSSYLARRTVQVAHRPPEVRLAAQGPAGDGAEGQAPAPPPPPTPSVPSIARILPWTSAPEPLIPDPLEQEVGEPEEQGAGEIDVGSGAIYETTEPGCLAAYADLTGSSVLAHGNPEPLLDRPVLSVLCQWLAEGWSNLLPGDGPEEAGFSGWEWVTRYPFAGPSSREWETRVGWPSDEGSEWLVGPVVQPASGIQMDLLPVAPWLRLNDRVFVMLGPDPLPDGATPDGFAPLDAVAIGLAWRVLEQSVGSLHDWASYTRDHVPSAGLQDYVGFKIRQGPFWNQVPILPFVEAWTSGAWAGPSNALHIWKDGSGANNWGASSTTQSIRVATAAAAAGGQLAKLRDAALSHWAYYQHGPTSPDGSVAFQPIPLVTLRQAGEHLARLAGFLAHELLHIVWRLGAGAGSWHDNVGGAGVCAGPRLEPAALKSYKFPSTSHPYDLPPPWGTSDTATSKHFVTYLYQWFAEGLLKHDLAGRLDNRHNSWCTNCSTYRDRNC